MTTAVQPREPHYFGVRIDRQRALALGNLCRCQNPAGHGDAWSVDYEDLDMDIHGNWLSWRELANRVLDHCGKPTVTRKEEYESYRYILHPMCYRDRMQDYHRVNRHVGMGGHVMCSPFEATMQFHGGDGHVRNNVTENGVRTMVNRPGGFTGHGPYGGRFGGPRVSRR